MYLSPYSVFLSVVSLEGVHGFNVSYGKLEVLGTSLTDKYRAMIGTDCTQIFILRHSSTSRKYLHCKFSECLFFALTYVLTWVIRGNFIDFCVFYAVSAVFRPYKGSLRAKLKCTFPNVMQQSLWSLSQRNDTIT